MKFINFDNYIKKMIMNILIKTVLRLCILRILSSWVLQDVQKPIYYSII